MTSTLASGTALLRPTFMSMAWCGVRHIMTSHIRILRKYM